MAESGVAVSAVPVMTVDHRAVDVPASKPPAEYCAEENTLTEANAWVPPSASENVQLTVGRSVFTAAIDGVPAGLEVRSNSR